MPYRALSLWLALSTAAFLLAPAASAVHIDWVLISYPGNAADTPSSNCSAANCGSVSYDYYISKYEVTNAQYAEFLNAVDWDGSNPHELYYGVMGSDATNGGISLVSSNPLGSKYVVKPGFASKPVTYTTFYRALRFANWLNNGQGEADTETGAYTLLGGTGVPSNAATVARNADAKVFLPSENEWYKAAYYTGSAYRDYPANNDFPTVCTTPTATLNRANCDNPEDTGQVTNVGAYTGSASPLGTFDQGGNVFEWNEERGSGFERSLRGGSVFSFPGYLAASSTFFFFTSVGTAPDAGFRVASLIGAPCNANGDFECIDNYPGNWLPNDDRCGHYAAPACGGTAPGSCTVTCIQQTVPVPTLSHWGVILLGMLLLAATFLTIRGHGLPAR